MTCSKRGRAALISSIAAVSLVVAACGSSSSSSSGSGSAQNVAAASSSGSSGSTGLSGKKVFLLGCGSSVPYCAVQNKTFKQAFAGTGAQVTVLESNYDPTVQAQQIGQALSQQPAAIGLVAAVQSPEVPELEKAKAAHVPVLLMNNPPVPSSLTSMYKSWVGANDATEATAAANALIAGLKAEGKTSGNIIEIQGAPGGATSIRQAAFVAAMKNSPYKVVDSGNGEWDPITAQKVAQQLLAKDQGKNVVGAYGMSGAMAAGVVQAAQQTGTPVGVAKKGLVIVGDNCAATSIKDIQGGSMYADIYQPPLIDGQVDAKAIKTLLSSGSLPTRVTTSNPLITKGNVSQYATACSY
jgi:ABC-type sugar transport system substrate-binding protein